ncbi:MAG: hypothetical protein WBE76_13250 [Terracidiphilus sp.]
MADADQQDPTGTNEELDLKNFIRPSTDAEWLDLARRTADLDLKSFYRTPEEAAKLLAARATAKIDIQDYYRPPGAEPQDLAGVTSEAEPQPGISPYALPEHRDAGSVAQETKPQQLDSEVSPAAGSPRVVLPGGQVQQLPAEAAKLPENPFYRIVSIGAMGGVMFGVVLIFVSWIIGNPSGPYDLGAVTSNATGLKGHLFTKWGDKGLEYRLAFEPSGPEQHAGFALAVANPPRPLSIDFQLKDAMGFVMCSRDILLKYDPAMALAPVPLAADSGKKGAADQADMEAARQADLMRLQTEEAQREQGKDIFQEQKGPDGQIAAFSAQGQIPCSKNSYEKISMWSFSPNFPSIDEQNAMVKQQAEGQAVAEHVSASHGKAVKKPAEKGLEFAIEGDDVLVGYDAAAGVLETGTGQTFYVDKQANLAGWQVFPLRIHYRCDQAAGCTVVRAGSAAELHARLRR